jgi:hypothetical protein
MAAAWSEIVRTLRKGCAGAGLDIVHPFAASEYNDAVGEQWQIEDFGRDRALCVLLANTHALWTPFRAALADDRTLAGDEHPLERYLELRLVPLLNGASDRRHALYWAHQTSPRALPIQRLAELVGLASLSPSHLSVHPEHGPWFALRAVAVFDVDGPNEPPPLLASPCVHCDKPCLPAFERAQALPVAEHADAWIAVRDACPIGRPSRYGDEQLGYHYTKDRKHLG